MKKPEPQTIVTFFPCRRESVPAPWQERDEEPYVTEDVAKRDRAEADRLTLIGFLHVGV